jgi:membrane-bound serine protease (ClpP class)
MEMKIASYGLLSIAGIISLMLGSLMLFNSGDPQMRLSLTVLIPTLVLISGFFVAVAALVFKSHLSKPLTGAQGLVGEIGIVKNDIMPEGKVFVHGELWNATAKEPIQKGARVRVVRVVNLVLEVEPVE